MLAHRHALQCHQADALAAADCRVVDCRQNLVGTGEAARAGATAAPDFLHGPQQIRFHRCGAGINVIAMQAQAGFQTQRVARTQTDRFDFGLCQQGAGQCVGLCVVHRDLKTVFAGVAAAGQKNGDGLRAGVHHKVAAGHEYQLFHAGCQTRQGCHGLWALQCEQRHLRHGDDFAARADRRLDVRNIGHLAGTIHHYKNVGFALHKHQVVHDAAIRIKQQAVALFAHRQVNHIHRHQALEGGCCVGPY